MSQNSGNPTEYTTNLFGIAAALLILIGIYSHLGIIQPILILTGIFIIRVL